MHELEPEPEPEEDELYKKKPKKIPNQFNFCERATLTYDNPLRVRVLNSTCTKFTHKITYRTRKMLKI